MSVPSPLKRIRPTFTTTGRCSRSSADKGLPLHTLVYLVTLLISMMPLPAHCTAQLTTPPRRTDAALGPLDHADGARDRLIPQHMGILDGGQQLVPQERVLLDQADKTNPQAREQPESQERVLPGQASTRYRRGPLRAAVPKPHTSKHPSVGVLHTGEDSTAGVPRTGAGPQRASDVGFRPPKDAARAQTLGLQSGCGKSGRFSQGHESPTTATLEAGDAQTLDLGRNSRSRSWKAGPHASAHKAVSTAGGGDGEPGDLNGGLGACETLSGLLSGYAARHKGATQRPGYRGKYVLVSDAPTNGLGNRLPGFVAGLLLALATERVLLCAWPELEPYFDSQLGLDYSWTRQVERYSAWQLPELSRQVEAVDNHTLWLQTDWRTDPRFNLRDVVEINYMADNLVPFMAANIHMRDFVKRHFGSVPIFRPLAAYLLRPSPHVRKRVDTFQDKNFGHMTVGLQMRRRKGLAHLLPEVRSYADAARALAAGRGVDARDLVVFVATDTPGVEEQVRALLPQSRVVWAHKDMEAHGTSGNPGSVDDALVDMFLLSECTDIVVTYGSSFGAVAAGVGGVLPTHLLPGPELAWDGWGPARRVFFFQGTTSEPCFTHSRDVLLSENTEIVAAWKDGCAHWMQHAQCHW